MRVARAFANLLRAAWHDPLWTLTMLVAPFLAFWPVVGVAALVLLVGFVFQDRFRPTAVTGQTPLSGRSVSVADSGSEKAKGSKTLQSRRW